MTDVSLVGSNRQIKTMNVMLKPAGSTCNLDCTYCFYLHKEKLLHPTKQQHISDTTLERFVEQYIHQQNTDLISFYWQGGEPTLMGLDFYKKVVRLQKKHCHPGMKIDNHFQTNGVVLNDKWCSFFRENDFLIGLSIDGPQQLHNLYRKNKAGNGSYLQVKRAAQLLHKHKVEFTTLTTVNNVTAKQPLEVYRFLRDEICSPFIQFIPIVEPKRFRTHAPQCGDVEHPPYQGSSAAQPGKNDSVVEAWSVNPDDWGTFLSNIFDEWFRNDIGQIFVQYFEAAVQMWIGQQSPLCTLAPICGKNLVMDFDGSIYSCDHYVYPEYKLGNLADKTLESMAFSEQQYQFAIHKEAALPKQCRECSYQFACFGECPKNRFIKTKTGEDGLNYLCSGWFKFWSHIDPFISQIVTQLGYPIKKGIAN